MEQVLPRPITIDTDTSVNSERDLLQSELEAARDAVARAYSRERLGLRHVNEDLKTRYDELSVEYGNTVLQERLQEITDQSERNALAIGFIIDEANRLSQRVDEFTEDNAVHKRLKAADEFIEKGSKRRARVMRIGATVIMAATGKLVGSMVVVGGTVGAMAGAGLSTGLQEVAKLRYKQIDEIKVDDEFMARHQQSDLVDVLASSRQFASQQIEQRIDKDHTMSRTAFKRGLGKAGIAAAFSGAISVGIDSFGSGSSAYAATPADGAGYDSLGVDTNTHGSIGVDVDTYTSPDVDLDGYENPGVEPTAHENPGVDLDTHDEIAVEATDHQLSLDADSDSHESPDVTLDTHQNPGVESVNYENPGVDLDTHESPDVDADTVTSPGVSVETDLDLPDVDNGEGLNQFVSDNYDYELTHAESMELGQELHEQGFMYYDPNYLGEKYGNPYGINPPGEIDLQTHNTIRDMIDDGQLNDSVGVEADVDVDTDTQTETDTPTTSDHSLEIDDESDVDTGDDQTPVDTETSSDELTSSEIANANQQIERLIESGKYSLLNTVELPGVDLGQLAEKFSGMTYSDGTPLVKASGDDLLQFNNQPDGASLPKAAMDFINGFLEDKGLNTYSYSSFNSAGK